jgi:hypothetical protein
MAIKTDGAGVRTEKQLLAPGLRAVHRVASVTAADTAGVKPLAKSNLNASCHHHNDKKNATLKLKPVAEHP